MTVQLNRIDGLPDNHVRGAAAKDCPCHECKKYAGGPAPKDRLGARELAEKVVAVCFPPPHDNAWYVATHLPAVEALIRAALEAVVRQDASTAHEHAHRINRGWECAHEAILKSWGLEEKP